MAIIRPDLTVTAMPSTMIVDAPVRGQIRIAAATLSERLGGDRVVVSPAGVMSLTPTDGEPSEPTVPATWNITAVSDAVLPWIFKVLTGSTAGFPAGRVGEARLGTFVTAYSNYAYERARCADEPAEVLNAVALQLRQCLHGAEDLIPGKLHKVADEYRAVNVEVAATLAALATSVADRGRRRTNMARLRAEYVATMRYASESEDDFGRYCVVLFPRNHAEAQLATYETFEEACEFVGDAVLDGDATEAIFDLDTEERIELHFPRPKVTRAEEQGVMANPLKPEGPQQ